LHPKRATVILIPAHVDRTDNGSHAIGASMGEHDRPESGRRPVNLQNWHSWLDRTIAEAEQRGDFDDLPTHGKPLHFDANPLTGEIDVGHSILKNAGMAPAWIELDREVRAGLDALATLRDESARYLAGLATRRPAPVPQAATPAPRPWWRKLFARAAAPSFLTTRPAAPPNLAAERASARARYLERAREVDTKIAAYNASLPPELWHLERARLTPERAGRDFDEVCPPPPDRSPAPPPSPSLSA
jgi:hypothetical protein